MTRQEWIDRAGTIAAQREAAGWTNPDIAVGRCPGVSTPEKRAAWHAAYTAAGMPEERRPEAEMTDGRLLVRARAAERARVAAPPAVYNAQRERHQLADQATRDAVLARAQGRHDDAARYENLAARHATLAHRLDDVADARARWLLQHAETTSAGDAARAELARRGIEPGSEPDRTTAEDYLEWLAAEARARADDDAYRPITESDLADGDARQPSNDDAELARPPGGTPARDVTDTDHVVEAEGVTAENAVSATRTTVGLSAAAAEAEIAAAAAQAQRAAAVLADQATQSEPVDDAEVDLADTTGDERTSDWEAERARQIAAEQDAIAAGVWHDEAPGTFESMSSTPPVWQADAG